MSKTFKILILVLVIGGMIGFSLPKTFQGAAQEELPIFVKEEPTEKIERPLYVPDEIIVKFKPGAKKEDIENFNRQQETEEVSESPYAHFKVLKIPKTKTVEEMAAIYKKNPNVEYVEPNYYAYAIMVPNDTYYSYQWHFDDDNTNNPGGATSNPYGGANGGGIRMEEAWNISTGTNSVIVAVVDTGIRVGTDLAATCFVTGYDFVNNNNDPIDDNGHGTHVAGTIAQSTNNNLGVAGIAFNSCLMPVKVLDARGSGTYAQVANGIYFAAKGPDEIPNTGDEARVINLSLGGTASDITLQGAVQYAYEKGITVVAAAGNDGEGGAPSYPAAYDNYVIAVGATQYDETRAPYSTTGSYLDLVAPGGNTSLDQNGDGYADGVLQQTFTIRGRTISWAYWFYQGTSMATPHVAGTAALVIANGVTGPDNVRAALETTAEDKGTAGWDQYYGYGIVDAYAALTYTPVAVSISLTTDGLVEFGIVALEATVDNSGDIETVRVDTGPANLNIQTTLFSDGTNNWALGETNGDNRIVWEYSKVGTTWSQFLEANTLYLFDSNVPQAATRDLYLRITMPTKTVSSAQHSSTVTIVATSP